MFRDLGYSDYRGFRFRVGSSVDHAAVSMTKVTLTEILAVVIARIMMTVL